MVSGQELHQNLEKDVLLKFAELLRKHGDENSVLECIDTGKLIGDCINEVANDCTNAFSVVWGINR